MLSNQPKPPKPPYNPKETNTESLRQMWIEEMAKRAAIEGQFREFKDQCFDDIRRGYLMQVRMNELTMDIGLWMWKMSEAITNVFNDEKFRQFIKEIINQFWQNRQARLQADQGSQEITTLQQSWNQALSQLYSNVEDWLKDRPELKLVHTPKLVVDQLGANQVLSVAIIKTDSLTNTFMRLCPEGVKQEKFNEEYKWLGVVEATSEKGKYRLLNHLNDNAEWTIVFQKDQETLSVETLNKENFLMVVNDLLSELHN